MTVGRIDIENLKLKPSKIPPTDCVVGQWPIASSTNMQLS